MAPTGVAMRDPRQRLFGAAERILLRAERDSGRLDLLIAPEVLGRAIVGCAYQLLIDGYDVDERLRQEVAELLSTPSQVQDSAR